MEQKVCLDTDVVIAILNNEDRAAQLINKIEQRTIFITTITLFELLLRKTNLQVIETFREKAYVLEFDEDSVRKASVIFKELEGKGKIIDIRDIFIVAISLANGCSLATFNKKHFEHINQIILI